MTGMRVETCQPDKSAGYPLYSQKLQGIQVKVNKKKNLTYFSIPIKCTLSFKIGNIIAAT
jgi:hypothetical protein